MKEFTTNPLIRIQALDLFSIETHLHKKIVSKHQTSSSLIPQCAQTFKMSTLIEKQPPQEITVFLKSIKQEKQPSQDLVIFRKNIKQETINGHNHHALQRIPKKTHP
jgi:hypothetical protein